MNYYEQYTSATQYWLLVLQDTVLVDDKAVLVIIL